MIRALVLVMLAATLAAGTVAIRTEQTAMRVLSQAEALQRNALQAWQVPGGGQRR